MVLVDACYTFWYICGPFVVGVRVPKTVGRPAYTFVEAADPAISNAFEALALEEVIKVFQVGCVRERAGNTGAKQRVKYGE